MYFLLSVNHLKFNHEINVAGVLNADGVLNVHGVLNVAGVLNVVQKSLVIHERNTKKISTMTVSLYLIKYDIKRDDNRSY